ncbi:MAG: lactate utilization protein [Candidatus Latescibacteria bacterium]|nr:lactate utilization protein [Candidatus Latescibacterota bacterium]
MSTDLIDAFAKKYESLAGIAHVADDADAVVPIVLEVLKEVDCKRVVLAELPNELHEAIVTACGAAGIDVLQQPFDNRELPHSIDAAEVGVSWAAFAVAESGSLVEFALDDAVRLVSTLPRIHIGIFKASTLLENLMDAAEPLRQFYIDYPQDATATFISGPSRTADIEMRLTLGVHGPEVAHAIVLQT